MEEIEEIKTGNPNYKTYKQINDNFKKLNSKKNTIEEIDIDNKPLTIKENKVNIPLKDYLKDLFKNASYDISSSVLSFTKYNDSKLDIELPMGLKQVVLNDENNLIFTQSNNSTLTVNLSSLKSVYIGDNTTIEIYNEQGVNKIRVKEGVFTKKSQFDESISELNTQINKSISDIKKLQDGKVDKVYNEEGVEDKHILQSVLNQTLTAYATIIKLNEEIAKVTAIAQGKSRAKVFDTKQALDAWLQIPENVASLQIGDDFLIKETGTPDYWWDGQNLVEYETRVPDITNMVTTDTEQTIEAQKDFTVRPTVNNKPIALQEDIQGNIYTDEDKQKLQGIEAGAQVNKVNSVAGKTGDIVLSKEDIGLNNVDNTSDLDKPISTAQQGAFDRKVDKEEGKGLSTNDFTMEEKNKLAGLQNYDDSQIREELEVVKQGTVTEEEKQTWNNKLDSESDPTVPEWAKEPTKPIYDYSEIQNKPTIPTKTSELENDSNFLTGDSSQFVDLSSEQEIPGKKIFENAQGAFTLNAYTSAVSVDTTKTIIRPLLLKGDYVYCVQYNYILKVKITDNTVTKTAIKSGNTNYTYVWKDKLVGTVNFDGTGSTTNAIFIYDTNTDICEKVFIVDAYVTPVGVIGDKIYIHTSSTAGASGQWYAYNLLEKKLEGPFDLPLLQDSVIILEGVANIGSDLFAIVRGVGTSGTITQSTYYIAKFDEESNTFKDFVLTNMFEFYDVLWKEYNGKIFMSGGYRNVLYDPVTNTCNSLSVNIPGVGSTDVDQIIKQDGADIYMLSHRKYIIKLNLDTITATLEETLPVTTTYYTVETPNIAAYGANSSTIYYFKKISYSNFVTLDQLNSILEGYTKKS